MRVAASKALRKAGEVFGLQGNWGRASEHFARAAAVLQALVDSGATAPSQEVVRQDLADVFALHAAGRTKVIAEERQLEDVNICVDDVLASRVPARVVFIF